jgi:arylformamidase
MRLYRNFSSQEEIDREYNPTASIPDAQSRFARWTALSEAAIHEGRCELGIAYGPTRAEYLDIFPAADRAPVHVFVHGGYWRRFSARDHAFIGAALARCGFTGVVVNYDLCPRVTIDEITREIRSAIAWTYKEIARFGGDRERLSVSGHSAGGHLVGMLLATDWPGEYGLPRDLIKGALPISGLFDLAPFPFSYLQPSLQLTWDQVRRNSPLALEPHACGAVTIAVGGLESAEFRRQSKDYARHLETAAVPSRYLECTGRHHLSIVDGLIEPGDPINAALVQLGDP